MFAGMASEIPDSVPTAPSHRNDNGGIKLISSKPRPEAGKLIAI